MLITESRPRGALRRTRPGLSDGMVEEQSRGAWRSRSQEIRARPRHFQRTTMTRPLLRRPTFNVRSEKSAAPQMRTPLLAPGFMCRHSPGSFPSRLEGSRAPALCQRQAPHDCTRRWPSQDGHWAPSKGGTSKNTVANRSQPLARSKPVGRRNPRSRGGAPET